MTLSFDKFERYEVPQVTLCNPNSRATEVDGKITITDTVGVLSNPSGMNLKLNFNAPHELSFDYCRHKSSDPIKQSFYDKIYEAIQTDRYIYLTDIGYFTIKNSTDSDEDNIDKKSISLKSCEENELASAEGLHLKEGTYYLHTENNDGLLDLFFPKTAGWTIGFIDPSLLAKPYFVEETEVDNGYNFLYTTIQDMFECIVEPDIIRRTISFYSRVYYAEHHLTDIHIAKYNLLKHKTVEENDEDKYTALNVQGKDENLEIRAVNPTGKNVIYNFEPRYSWMSPALQQAIEKWQEKCESIIKDCTQYVPLSLEFQGGYADLQKEYYDELEKLFNEEQNIEVLKGQLKQLEETRDIAFTMADGDEKDQSLNNVNKAITTKQKEISSATSTYNAHNQTVNTTYEIPIAKINSDCALDTTAKDIDGNTIFTIELLNELMTHIKPTDYVDEYMLVTESMTYPQRFEKAKELMDRAQSQLVKISSGQKTYSIDTRSFLFNKQFRHFSEQLCAGAIIYVETKTDKMEQLHLTGIDINFDEKSTNFTLGNKYDRSDLKALYEDALGQNSKSFSELKYIAGILEDQQKQLDYQRNWVADLRTLTLDNVLTSEDQAIEINNRGLIGRKRRLDKNGEWDFDENGNPYFEDEQVKLIHNSLIFTKDNWEHAEAAIGKIAVGYNADGSVKYDYGFNGRVLIGELMLGNNLILTGTGAGIKIKDSNGRDAFYADDDGNLVLSGTIFAKSGDIGGWKIHDNYLGTDWGAIEDVWFISQKGQSALSDFGAKTWMIYCKGHFGVSNDGGIYASKGQIADYTISGAQLIGNNVGMSGTSGQGWAFWAGSNDSGAAPFRVGHEGLLYATNAYIEGIIGAKEGYIGGWTVKDGRLYSANNSYGTGMSAITTFGGDPAFWAGLHGWGDNPWNNGGVSGYWYNHCNFYVKNDGYLFANNAKIKGTIESNSGIIAGWHIGKDKYHNEDGLYYEYVTSEIQKYTLLSINGIKMHWQPVDYNYNVSWAEVCRAATNGSDFRIKNTIEDLNKNAETFFDSLLPCSFYYNQQASMGSSRKKHFGFVAQDVIKSMHNADILDFAGIWNSDITSFYNLDKQEFIALNTWQIQRCKKRIADLENTVVELKTQIQTLTAG